jgi:cell division protein FtsB
MRNEKLRIRMRFSIRTLLIFLSLMAAALGTGTFLINDFRQQARSLAVVQRLDGKAESIPASGRHGNVGWSRR